MNTDTFTAELEAQHANYEADLEPTNYGLHPDDHDILDFDTDITITRPCPDCTYTHCDCETRTLNWDMPCWGIWGS